MPTVITPTGRRVEVPQGWSLVPIPEAHLVTIIRRVPPRNNLLVGLELNPFPHKTGRHDFRVAVIPAEVVDGLRQLVPPGPDVTAPNVGPPAAYGILLARFQPRAGEVGARVSFGPPAVVPPFPPYPFPVAQTAAVTFKTLDALLFAAYGRAGAFARTTLEGALKRAGWVPQKRVPGATDFTYAPPPNPPIESRAPAFVPRAVVQGQARFE
ncbi:MAG: hypothetical protein ACREB9_00280 [Thermoplasmata archaeon]